ncbi:MAG: sporulation protein YqfC [Clostridia bacterium]|nr:sporulation protein YqfC [Clostridia bacterium]
MPVNRNNRRNKKKKEEEAKPKLKEKVTEILELPKEIVLNVPRLTLIGNGNLLIENYKGIIEYDDKRVRVNTGSGIIKIVGDRLVIKEITSEDIMIDGEIQAMEFIK